jgi:hypothetical protein
MERCGASAQWSGRVLLLHRNDYMKITLSALGLALLICNSALASDRNDVVAAVRSEIAAFNRGDLSDAIAHCTDEMSIIDNFPPHEWHGAGACTRWASDLVAFLRDAGITPLSMIAGRPRHVDVVGDRAYVVIPTMFRFKLNGKVARDPGQLTFAMMKMQGNWKFTGWSWSDQ